ncbi:nlr family card domain-containing protein [Anaeramoeba flamelloides]|uniref:Nlr family card domain-containing protein n=1 Tax=Anaeramoeba flamelloides TaxID=1746091 RepID=A0ABQ8Y429_9EUKA|nr:nlr family card domain-containing protein [Anaeramoeba flamelloides]
MDTINSLNPMDPEEEFKIFLQRLILNDQTLDNLDLYDSQIGVEGIEPLSEALKENQTLTNLKVTGKRFGDKGTQALSEALKVNQTLTRIGTL